MSPVIVHILFIYLIFISLKNTSTMAYLYLIIGVLIVFNIIFDVTELPAQLSGGKCFDRKVKPCAPQLNSTQLISTSS